MTAKKPAKKTTKKATPKKKAPAKKKAAPKAAPKAEEAVNEKLAELAKPAVETPKQHGTVIYAADVKSPSLKKKFFAWFKR